MRARFVPVPYVALALVGSQGRVAVLDIYMRAHTAMWRPFRTNERELSEAWGVDRRTVGRILGDLSAAGLLSFSRGDQWSGTVISVGDPSAPDGGVSAAPDDTRFFSPDETRSSSESAHVSAPDGGVSAAPDEAESLRQHARVVDTRAHEPNRTEPNRTEEGNKTPESPLLAQRTAVEEVYRHWRQYHKLASELPSDEVVRHIGARLKDIIKTRPSEDHVALAKRMIDHIHTGADTEFYRGKNEAGKRYDGIETLFKAKGFADRIEAALSWQASGAPATKTGRVVDYREEATAAWRKVSSLFVAYPREPEERIASGEGPTTDARERAVRSALRAMGGWSRIRSFPTHEEGSYRQQFVDHYVTARSST